MNNISLKTLSLAAITSALLSSVAIAQESSDSLKMDVTFVGEREMVVKDALKLQSWPELRKLESGEKEFSYRLLAKRMNVTPVWTMFFIYLLLSSLLIFKHRENIQRLLKGQEGLLSSNKKD